MRSIHTTIRRHRRVVAAALLVMLPLLWAIVIPWLAARTTLVSATPFLDSYGNDEVDYWIQVDAFVRAGMHAGQFGWEELAAPAGWTHFGPHGPNYHVLMGLVGKAVGWEYATPFFINVAFVVFGMLALLLIERPSARTSMLLLALFIGFWPMWDAHVSALQEPLHVGIALAMGALFARQVRDPDRWRALAGLILFASLFRVTWTLFLIPMIIMAIGSDRRRWWMIAAALLTPLPFGWLYTKIVSPYPYNPVSIAGEADTRLETLKLIWRNVLDNVATFQRTPDAPLPETPLKDLVFRAELMYVVVVLLVLSAIAGVRMLRAWRSGTNLTLAPHWRIVLVGLFGLVGMCAMTFILYQFVYMRGYRVLGPHLLVLLVLVALAARTRTARWSLAIFAVYGLATMPIGLHHVVTNTEQRYDGEPEGVAMLRRDTSAITFQDDASSPWCNTVLWRSWVHQWPEAFAGLPSGIAMNIDLPLELEPPYKSLWVVEDAASEQVKEHPDSFRRVGETEFGILYENLDSSCS